MRQVVKFKEMVGRMDTVVGEMRHPRGVATTPRKGEGAQQNTSPLPPEVPQRDHWQQNTQP